MELVQQNICKYHIICKQIKYKEIKKNNKKFKCYYNGIKLLHFTTQIFLDLQTNGKIKSTYCNNCTQVRLRLTYVFT